MIAALLLQALFITPFAFASSVGSHSPPAHCADLSQTDKQDAPCCTQVPGCMSLCTASAAIGVLPDLTLQVSNSTAIPFIPASVFTQNYPPPNPPPIG